MHVSVAQEWHRPNILLLQRFIKLALLQQSYNEIYWNDSVREEQRSNQIGCGHMFTLVLNFSIVPTVYMQFRAD